MTAGVSGAFNSSLMAKIHASDPIDSADETSIIAPLTSIPETEHMRSTRTLSVMLTLMLPVGVHAAVNVACDKTLCVPETDANICLTCWNSRSSDMEICFELIAWPSVFADGAALGNGDFSIAIETDPTVTDAFEISFGQPNLRGNTAHLDSQVDLTISTLNAGGHASTMAENPVVVHDYEHFFYFIRNQMPKGFTGDCPDGTPTTCDPTKSFEHADLNDDGPVGIADLKIIQTAMGSCEGDLDGNGFVDGADVGILIGACGPCLP